MLSRLVYVLRNELVAYDTLGLFLGNFLPTDIFNVTRFPMKVVYFTEYQLTPS